MSGYNVHHNFRSSTVFKSRVRFLVAFAAVTVIAACSDEPASPGPSAPLAGLSLGNSNDTTTGTNEPGVVTPGSFHGFVIGRGTGPDTFATAPRISGATITAYPHLGFDGETPRVGQPVGSVTTNSEGFFQFPVIAGGPYVVTIKPPAGSEYQGQYALTTISNTSNSGNWWVVLQK
jgi:hypothetical protein